MSLETAIPFRETEIDEAESTYFAVNPNPLVITGQRKDFAVVDTQDDGSGNTQINITGTLPTLTADGIATVYCAIDSITAGIYGDYVILSSTASTVVIDLPFTSPFTGGFINLTTDRPNYFVYTRIQAVYPTFPIPGGELPYYTRKDVPFSNGSVQINIQEQVSADFTSMNEFEFDVTDEIDLNNCIQYSVEFMEVWDGSTEDWSTAEVLHAVNAAMQVQNTGGSNMVLYITSGQSDKAKFLSDNNTVRYWEGLPFDTQMLFYNTEFFNYMDSNPGFEIKRRELQYDPSNPVPNESTTVLGSGTLTVFDTYKRLMLEGSYDSNYSYLDYSVCIDDSGTLTDITEKLRVRIEHEIPCNPVYLSWLNKKGGWNYFCFSHQQQFSNKVSTDGEYRKFFESLEDQYTTSSYLNKLSTTSMKAGADQMDFSDIQLMISLIESPRVFLLMNTPTWMTINPKWREIKVDVAEYPTFNTKKTNNPFEFKMRLPDTFIQRT